VINFATQVEKVYMNEAAASGSETAASSFPPKLLRKIRGIIFDFDGTLFDNALFPFYLIAAYPPDILRIWKERLIRKRFAGCDYSSTGDYYQAFLLQWEKFAFVRPKGCRTGILNDICPE
jgi:hypothetical protein